MVAGEYDQKIVDGQIIKERRYTLTAGDAAWTATRAFYSDAIDEYGARGPDRACVTPPRLGGGWCRRRCASGSSARRCARATRLSHPAPRARSGSSRVGVTLCRRGSRPPRSNAALARAARPTTVDPLRDRSVP